MAETKSDQELKELIGNEQDANKIYRTLHDNVFAGTVRNAHIRRHSLEALVERGLPLPELEQVFLKDKNEQIATAAGKLLLQKGYTMQELLKLYNHNAVNFEKEPFFFYKGKLYQTAD